MKEEMQDFDLCSNDGEDSSNLETDKAISRFKSRYRSPTFSHRETNFLLHCIMAEKQYINNIKNDSVSRQDRDRAWERVAKVYNKKFSEAPRSTKMLRTKYMNYKKKIYRVSEEKRSRTKHVNIDEEIDRTVKIEKEDLEGSEQSDSVLLDSTNNFEILFNEKELDTKLGTSSDPLSAVLNGFTNTVNNQNASNIKEDPNVVKLKIELLNYQLETAKMERERVKAAIEGEAADRRRRDELLSLQIQEAQLKISFAERHLNTQYPVNNVVHNSHYHVP